MSLIDLVFPKKCLECKREGKYICQNCIKNVRPGISTNSTFSVFRHEGVIRKAIIALKYKFATDIAGEIADISTPKLRKLNLPKKAILVPIPMFWYKKNFRGFNQAEILGEMVAGKMGWGFEPNLLIKEKPTKAQVELKGSERRQNLRHTFDADPKFRVKNTNYIIFDDVLTTGSTINEAENALRGCGADRIFKLTITR